MARDIGGGETRMEAAKRVMNGVIDALPERRRGQCWLPHLRSHFGDNTEARRDVAVWSSDLVVPIQGVNKPALRDGRGCPANRLDSNRPLSSARVAIFQAGEGGKPYPPRSLTVKGHAVATLAWSRRR